MSKENLESDEQPEEGAMKAGEDQHRDIVDFLEAYGGHVLKTGWNHTGNFLRNNKIPAALSAPAGKEPVPSKEPAGEKMFTLEQALDIWRAATDWMQTQILDSEKMTSNKQQYFKDKFNIEL